MSTTRLQQNRRGGATPPMTWEPWALAGLCLVAAWVYGVQGARAVANYWAGAGRLTWPTAEGLFGSIPAVLSGNAGAGLAHGTKHVASPFALYCWIGVMTLLVVAVAVGALTVWNMRRTRVHGLASRHEIERALGRGQVLRAAKELRPDLPARKARPTDLAVHLGRSCEPAGVECYVRADRTTGVLGEQGSGKTLDHLVPALLDWTGGALVTLTKPQDMLLSWTRRAQRGRCVAFDPYGMTPGLDELVWNPVVGCDDPMVAQRRARAFCAGTILRSTQSDDGAARFYADEAAKVLQGWFHAAALAGYTMERITQWAADPVNAREALALLNGPKATPLWGSLVNATLTGDSDTVGNTISTIQSALAVFFQADILRRCVPTPDRPATDIAAIIRECGTFYLVGRDDPYLSASPLMTALTEHILDTALDEANTSRWGRLTPGFHAFLDELPSTAPIPTLASHMANDRALGLSYSIYAQNYRQLVRVFGRDGAQEVWDLVNAKVVFGGVTDVDFARDVVALLGNVPVPRRTTQRSGALGDGRSGDSFGSEDIAVLTVDELRSRIPERQALVLYSRTPAFIVQLRRCIDGKDGRELLREQDIMRERVKAARRPQPASAPAAAARNPWTALTGSTTTKERP